MIERFIDLFNVAILLSLNSMKMKKGTYGSINVGMVFCFRLAILYRLDPAPVSESEVSYAVFFRLSPSQRSRCILHQGYHSRNDPL